MIKETLEQIVDYSDWKTVTWSAAALVTVVVVRQLSKPDPLARIPGPAQLPVVGGTIANAKIIFSGKVHELQEAHFEKYGKIWRSRIPFMNYSIAIADADLAKKILTDTVRFRRGNFLEQCATGILDHALFFMPTGAKHKQHRKLLQPSFAPSHLRQVPGATILVCEQLCQGWEAQRRGTEKLSVDFGDDMMNVTLDILGLIAFGREFGAVNSSHKHKDSVWSNLSDSTFVPVSKRSIVPQLLWPLLGLSSQSPVIKNTRDAIRAYCKEMVAGSMEKITAYDPAQDEKFELNLLERLMLSQQKGDLSEEEVFGEMLGLFIAGHETSSHTITFTVFELAKNPIEQERLYQEIKDFDLSGAGLEEKTLSIPFLDHVLKEAQRLHSIVGATIRETAEDMTLLGYFIPKGTRVVPAIRSIHRDPAYYPEPKRFNPDRWKQPINPNAFMPFGAGPMMCIGMKMALIEIKIVLIALLQKYRFAVPDDLSKLQYTTRVTHSVEGLKITLLPRH
ncbi:hypothetical protein HDV03_005161 [Kappamyces sp. JEL0829]|nr:hypothetical protein HDV03_005161 [Kappamyces sp. JEL0829]